MQLQPNHAMKVRRDKPGAQTTMKMPHLKIGVPYAINYSEAGLLGKTVAGQAAGNRTTVKQFLSIIKLFEMCKRMHK